MESVITIPSTRVYFDELPKIYVDSIKQTAKIYSWAKEKLYNIKYDKAFLKNLTENETAYIKSYIRDEFSCTPQDYYITSLMSHAGGMISSQKELVNMYESDFKIRHDTRKDKISKLQKNLKTLSKAKDAVI